MKINRVHISDIIDARRMDPIFFRYGTMQFGRNFRLEAISTCIVDIQSGVGAGKKDQADKNNGIIQVRPTNIDRNGMLIFDKNIYVYNPQIEMFARFKMKSSFHKTKRII